VASLLKIKAWIKAHWNWLVLVGLFCLAYILGKKSAASFLAQANIAKDQYKKDAEAVDKASKQKNKRDTKIDKKREEIKKALIKEREKKLKLVSQEKTDPDEVFKNIGIKKK
jgi:hypothetical protein